MRSITVRVPATSANLGPGFDCLGLALDIWNESIFSLEGEGCTVVISGEGSHTLPNNDSNLIAEAAYKLFERLHFPIPSGLLIRCYNRIPLSSGLGSSAAALVTGILGANAMMGNPLSQQEILAILTEMEGHGDNVVPAVLGGLAAVSGAGDSVIYRKVWDGSIGGDILQAAIVLPDVSISTTEARALLPEHIPFRDAVHNIQKTALLLYGFETGDLSLLGDVMQDRIHQPYRLAKIPGGDLAIQAARKSGAAAAAVSGAGPSIIAFGLEDLMPVASAMQTVFRDQGLEARIFLTSVSPGGAELYISEEG